MRKAFTVATAFTGAAACAALFAPGADAATTAKAQPIMPGTVHKNCAIGPATHTVNLNQHVHWVNIYKWSGADKCST